MTQLDITIAIISHLMMLMFFIAAANNFWRINMGDIAFFLVALFGVIYTWVEVFM